MIGHRIRGLRNKEKISQQKLAELTKLTKHRIGRIERNEADLTAPELIILCGLFDVSADFLLTGVTGKTSD